MSANEAPAPLALTMGEPAGIGAEIALAAWRQRAHVPDFFLIDDIDRLRALAAQLGWVVPFVAIEHPDQVSAWFMDALPVLPCALSVETVMGRPDPANAAAVIRSIEMAVALVREGAAGAVVTNPIQKSVLAAAGFRHPGHTEFLAELAGPGTDVVMMLACPGLRVVPVTVHLALADAIRALSTEAIITAGKITALSLTEQFGIDRPRLAIAALNPHAGEQGRMGREEIEIIGPAVSALRDLGIDATGPLPADTLFHEAARSRSDAVLCMYHDQALIPLKTIDFAGGVNVTLGLPFIRTSPDHGTALDIAGSGRADPASLIAALTLADELARQRALRL